MAQKSTWKKIGIGVLGTLIATAVIAAGVKIGNVGYKKTMDDLKDAIKEKLENKKDSTTPTEAEEQNSTSSQAAAIEFVEFVA